MNSNMTILSEHFFHTYHDENIAQLNSNESIRIKEIMDDNQIFKLKCREELKITYLKLVAQKQSERTKHF